MYMWRKHEKLLLFTRSTSGSVWIMMTQKKTIICLRSRCLLLDKTLSVFSSFSLRFSDPNKESQHYTINGGTLWPELSKKNRSAERETSVCSCHRPS